VVVNGPHWLVTSPFDMHGTFGTTLRFQRWLNTEAPPHAAAMIEATGDDVNWIPVWSNAEGIGDDVWTAQTYHIAGIVDRQATARIRFGYETLSTEALPCSNWNIDDVEIWAVPEGTARIGLTVGRTSLSWTPVLGALTYDAVEGSLAALAASSGDFAAATTGCVAGAVAETTLPYAGEPAPGGSWYLVRGRTAEGPMTWESLYPSQVGLRDEEIAAGATCP
jgi:hypothetical protein